MLCFNHYLISSQFQPAGKTIAEVQHRFQKVKMDVKTINSSKKKLHISVSVNACSICWRVGVCAVDSVQRREREGCSRVSSPW